MARRFPRLHVTSVTCLALTVCSLAPRAPAQEGRRSAELEEILDGLRHGIRSLHALRRHEQAEQLERLAHEVADKLEHAAPHGRRDRERSTERDILQRELDVMRVGMKALLEADERELVHTLEHAIHARELALAGRRDHEAMRIQDTAPSLGNQAEILMHASELLRDLDRRDRAEMVMKLARSLAERSSRQRDRRRRGSERDRPVSEREVAERQLGWLEQAFHAMQKADRRDGAELLELAMHARKLALAGRRDEEAMEIRRRAPNRRQLAELVGVAAELWAEEGHEEKAAALGRFSRELAGRGERERPAERERERSEGGREEGRREVEELRERLQELQRAMQRISDELERLKRRR